MTSAIPDVAVVGVQKCGTTSLARIFDLSPGLSVSEPKEPNFFNSEPAGRFYCESLRWSDRADTYRRFFSDTSDRLTVDCSIQLAFDEVGLSRLRGFNPDVRVVVLVREPRARAVSAALHLHRLMVMHGDERAEDAARRPDRLFGDFAQLERYSRYRAMLELLRGAFTTQQVLLLVMEEAFGEPSNACARIGDHIGRPLPFVSEHWARSWNRTTTPASGVVERGLRTVSRMVAAVAGSGAVHAARRTGLPDRIRHRFHSPGLAAEIKRRAREHVQRLDFSADVAAVESWLGREVSAWQ